MSYFTNWYKATKGGLLSLIESRHDNISFNMVYGPASWGEHEDVIKRIEQYVLGRQFEKTVSEIKALETKTDCTANGDPLFYSACLALFDPMDDRHGNISPAEYQKYLQSYEAWQRSSPDCPYAAASYAYFLGATGYAYRGTDWARNVKPDDMLKLKEYGQRGIEQFHRSQAKHGDHWFWNVALHRFSSIDCPKPEEIIRRFEACLNCLPMTPSLFDRMGYFLLPRWFGDFELIEEFAQQSVENTKQQIGDALYARIYAGILEFEEAADLHIDKNQFAKGAREWIERFPDQFIQTQLASSAYELNDYELAQDILEQLDTFYHEAWEFDDGPKIVNSICREFTGR